MGSDGQQTCGYNCRMGSNGHFYCSSRPDGRCAMNSDGTFTFDPGGAFDFLADGDTDSVSFSYIIDDGTQTSTATATIDILGLNDGPEADAVLFDTDEDNSVSVNLIDGVVRG